jgi:prepilin-type N-terminal cleavage/methylation domain-containing protein
MIGNMKKGFTLIELLVVIAILAILSVAVVLVLNPAELLRQSRDSTRISDLATINSSIGLFLADVRNPTWNTTTTCTSGTVAPAAPGPNTTSTCVTNSSIVVTGTGWVNVDFTAISTGSPLPKLPVDPVNDSTSAACAGTPSGCFYVYRASTTIGKYKLYANMESAKFKAGGSNDVESNSKDGGNSDSWYEIGGDMTL